MAEDLERAFQEIRVRLKARLLGAVASIQYLGEDSKEDERRVKAAREEVDNAGKDALKELDGLRDIFHP